MANELKTVSNFAKQEGVSRQCIHYRIKKGYLDSYDIDGITFVLIPDKKLKIKTIKPNGLP